MLSGNNSVLLFSFHAENQQRQTARDSLLHTAVQRLGAILVLMLTVGDWSDVLHVLITFLGEAACLLPSQDLLEAVLKVCVNNLSTKKNINIFITIMELLLVALYVINHFRMKKT